MFIKRKRSNFIKLFALIMTACIVSLSISVPFMAATEDTVSEGSQETGSESTTEKADVTRPSTNGHLRVRSAKLVDENFQPARLRGVSTHGTVWYPDFVNERLFQELSTSWNCNLVRLATYSDQYCNGKKEESLELVRKGIDAAIKADMYVLVDWHILLDSDPNIHINEASEFFNIISSEYADVPNIIYEICNEPNGETTWSSVRSYANRIIPEIRKNSPSSVIIVGTPDYCKNIYVVLRNPLKFDNIMYTLHFYAATHKGDLQTELLMCLNKRLPIFVTECGLSESSGDGDLDYESAIKWFGILENNNLSFAVWSLSNKNETSALFEPDYNPNLPIEDNNLTDCGLWVRSLIMGDEPSLIPVPRKSQAQQLIPRWIKGSLSYRDMVVAKSWPVIVLWTFAILIIGLVIILLIYKHFKKHYKTYNDLLTKDELSKAKKLILYRFMLFFSILTTIAYLTWRIVFSIPKDHGTLPIVANIILLVVEFVGFFESVILYMNLIGIRNYDLPSISDDEYPDVDIFIATYNEPVDLLRKTINGCNHLRYPDKSKVHVWLCDDNRRAEMKQLAADMGIGYFDRPDNKGAKAGNLNNALSKTNSPYVVTFDSDMIPKSDFLLKTIPYFVDAEKRSAELPDNKKCHLGLLQTPQSFYDPDVYQYALYSEKAAPNEQDFFYRTIEVARTSTNSVIYGGSNTILSRRALEDIGGFYTETITEDFATGLLIESAGYVSLALAEPLANGQTPHSFKEHIQQRKRWGMGVINSSRKLHLIRRKGLSLPQKLNYISSVSYWFSPIKNFIYMISPLLFAVFAIPVFECSWLDLVMYWLPMFILQELCLRVISRGTISLKWSGIYETSVMPYLLIPILKESLGLSLSVFAVTDKSGRATVDKKKFKTMLPLLILLALSLFGIVRVILLMKTIPVMNLIVLLFWIVRNTYFIAMSIFLIDGRYGNEETVNVKDAEFVTLKNKQDDGETRTFDGVTTYLNEHSVKVFLDEDEGLKIGDKLELTIENELYDASLQTILTGIQESRSGKKKVFSLEIVDYGSSWNEYEMILFDRTPSLPQSLTRDYGIVFHLLSNIAHRVLQHE